MDANQFTRQVNKVKPLGKTPITSSIEQAIKGLGKDGGTIILLADGPENCRRNLCEFLSSPAANNTKVTIHVVAFAMPPKEANSLRCVAKSTNGRFFMPDNLQGLEASLTTAFKASLKGLGFII